MLAYTVSQRTREIGLRMALGAAPARVRAMVLRQVGWMMAIGGADRAGGRVALGRGAEAILFEIKGYDPIVLARRPWCWSPSRWRPGSFPRIAPRGSIR